MVAAHPPSARSLFGPRDWLHGRRFFHRPGWGGGVVLAWFKCITLIVALFPLLHCLYLRSWGVRSQRLGSPASTIHLHPQGKCTRAMSLLTLTLQPLFTISAATLSLSIVKERSPQEGFTSIPQHLCSPGGSTSRWMADTLVSVSLLVGHSPLPSVPGQHLPAPWPRGVSLGLSFSRCDLGIGDVCCFLVWSTKPSHPWCPNLFPRLLVSVEKLRVALGPTWRRCQRCRVTAAWVPEWKELPKEGRP